jgi:phage-related protein
MNYRVELTENVIEFILSLPNKMQAKAQRTINLLKEFGYALPEPHSKKLKSTNGLFELRIKLGSDICRLFYFYWKDKIFVITSGYIKKSNKTDQKQILKAISIMNQLKR